jgi:hypothetical protein
MDNNNSQKIRGYIYNNNNIESQCLNHKSTLPMWTKKGRRATLRAQHSIRRMSREDRAKAASQGWPGKVRGTSFSISCEGHGALLVPPKKERPQW